MAVTDAQKQSLLFLLKNMKRRRKPILRYIFPTFPVWYYGALAVLLLINFVVYALAPTLLEQSFAITGGAVFVMYARVLFRTRFDEKAEFVRKAKKIGVESHDAGDFYDEHAGAAVLV
ncbi:MAG: hypothetical protein AAFR65_03540 [Pseudomonadota bacterium]